MGKFSEEKHQDTSELLESEETEVLDLDLIEFGERRLTEDESSENLEQTADEIEGSGDEELEVKEMEILERTNHETNLEVPQTITGPANVKLNFMREMFELRNALRNSDS